MSPGREGYWAVVEALSHISYIHRVYPNHRCHGHVSLKMAAASLFPPNDSAIRLHFVPPPLPLAQMRSCICPPQARFCGTPPFRSGTEKNRRSIAIEKLDPSSQHEGVGRKKKTYIDGGINHSRTEREWELT